MSFFKSACLPKGNLENLLHAAFHQAIIPLVSKYESTLSDRILQIVEKSCFEKERPVNPGENFSYSVYQKTNNKQLNNGKNI